ncbi:MAG: hypothetical protein QXU98_03060 [Candidatus Parvarchaeota archaeon]
MDDIEATVREFLKTTNINDICNEAELQFELALFIKENLRGSRIYLERSCEKFNIKDRLIKKEIDLVVQRDDGSFSAIELKYPKNGRVPETMYDFIKDIKFLEQLSESKNFKRNFFLAITGDKGFWKGESNRIYAYFRGGENLPSNKPIYKPTGPEKGSESISLNAQYSISWELIPSSNPEMKFLLIRVN